jgi:hypothetical protein
VTGVLSGAVYHHDDGAARRFSRYAARRQGVHGNGGGARDALLFAAGRAAWTAYERVLQNARLF